MHAPVALASSLSAEDMVIADVILRHRLDIEIFTLDTGRLHGDTLDLIAAIRKRYAQEVRVLRPDPAAVAAYVAEFGRDAFYESATLRKRCREIRIEGIGSLVNPVTTEQAMHASRLRERGTQVATHEHGEKHESAST